MMTMSWLHPPLKQLKAFTDGEPAGEELAPHLARCTSCRGVVAALRALSAALVALPAPLPSPDLRARILTARAAGTRVILPADEQSPARFSWRLAMTVGAAALVVLAIGLSVLRSSSDESSSSPAVSFFLAPSIAFAQRLQETPAPPKYSLLDQVDGGRLVPGRWTYQGAVIVDGIQKTDSSRRTLTVAGDSLNGGAAWRIANDWVAKNGRGGFVDTIFVDRGTLAPLRRAVDYTRYSLTQEFTSDSVSGTFFVKATPRFPSRSERGTAALRHPTVDWMTLKPLLRALPLAASWRGSVYVMFMAPQRDSVYFPSFMLDLRVAGHERVTVPAGTFDCWKIVMGVPAFGVPGSGYSRHASELWVSRDGQWVIQVREQFADDMVFQEQLTEHSDSPTS